MKNIFLRKPEIPPSKPSRSHRPTDAYNVWIPPEASRVPTPGPSARASSNAGPSHAQESYRGTGRTLPRPEPPSSNSYKYTGGQTTKTGFSYSNHAPQPVPVQPIPIQPYGQYYLSNPPTSSIERPESRNGYTTYVPTHFQYPHFPGVPVPQPTQSEYRRAKEEKRRARESSARPSPKKHREKEATTSSSRAPHLATSTSSIRLTPDELEPRHRKRDAGEVRTRKDSRTKEEDQIRDPARKREKESRRKSKVDGRMDEGESSDGSVQRPLTAGHHLRHTDGKKLQPPDPAARTRAVKPPADIHPAPQLSNTIPVQLPAPSQRPNQTAPAPESDTERGGTLSRGRSFLRATGLAGRSKQASEESLKKKVKEAKESKGIWPFSRSKSSQKIPPVVTVPPPVRKARADSTPSSARPPLLQPDVITRPEHRRYASELVGNSRTAQQRDQPQVEPQRFELPRVEPPRIDKQRTEPSRVEAQARAMLFAQPPPTSQSRVSRVAGHEVPPSLSSADPVHKGPARSDGPPLSSTMAGHIVSHGRDSVSYPSLYAPPVANSSSNAENRVSQLVTSYEARLSDTQLRPAVERAPTVIQPASDSTARAAPKPEVSSSMQSEAPKTSASQQRPLHGIPKTASDHSARHATESSLLSRTHPESSSDERPSSKSRRREEASRVSDTRTKHSPPLMNSRRAEADPKPPRPKLERDRDDRPSRSKREVVPVPVMKTPSKDSSRHTSSPSSVLLHQRASDKERVSPLHNPVKPLSTKAASSSSKPERPFFPSLVAERHTPLVNGQQSQLPPADSALFSPGPVAPDPVVRPPSVQPESRASIHPSPQTLMVPPIHHRPSEESILKTPSSLAQSIFPPTASRTSLPASLSTDPKRKGLLGMFRAKPGNESEPEPYSHNRPSSRNTRSAAHRDEDTPRAVPPSPITIPKPQAVAPDRKSPNSRVFSSFRYLTTKRYNRVSTASMDAVDGTATNTVMGSPTASHQSSQFPSSSPPQRDPWAATEDWRVSEQAHHETSRRPGRRQRPGIVFDVPEDPFEETKRSRPARLRKSAPTPQPEPDAADVPAAEPDE